MSVIVHESQHIEGERHEKGYEDNCLWSQVCLLLGLHMLTQSFQPPGPQFPHQPVRVRGLEDEKCLCALMFQERRFPRPSVVITLHFSLTFCHTLCPWRLTFMDWLSWAPLTSGLWVEAARGETWQEIRRTWAVPLPLYTHKSARDSHPRGSCRQDLVTQSWPSDRGVVMAFCCCLAILFQLPYACPGTCKESLCEEFSSLSETLGMPSAFCSYPHH